MPDEPSAPRAGASSKVAAFLDEARTLATATSTEGRGRLAVILDATMSREATWDAASRIQGEMFDVAKTLGGLDVMLIYFRGFQECRASRWARDPAALARAMSAVGCRAGATQIGRALAHVEKHARAGRLDAFVFVGDAFEECEDAACETAGRLGLLGVKGFFFQERDDPVARRAFDAMAGLTGGARHRFDLASAHTLRTLLGAAAAYAAGGRGGLDAYARRQGGPALDLARRLTGPSEGAR